MGLVVLKVSDLKQKVEKNAVWTLGDLVVVGSCSCRMEDARRCHKMVKYGHGKEG